MINFIKLTAVIERDLRKFIRNPLVIAMSLLMPILYLIILGNSFQGKLKDLPLVVVNEDAGPYARRIEENLHAIHVGPETLTILTLSDEKMAIDGVRKGVYKAALIIPPDFSKRVDVKSVPEVGLFLDNTDGISSETIRNVVNGAILSINVDYVSIREAPEMPVMRDIDLYKNVDYYQSLVPGVVIMAIFLGTLATGAFNLVMDRFLGTDESYLLTPLSKSDLVAGLIISGVIITTITTVVTLTVSSLLAGISIVKAMVQFPAILMIIILTTLSLLSLMFVLLGRANHPRIVGLLSGFMNVILFFPSGAIYPIASFPPWLRAFATVNPESYAVDALKALLFKGAHLGTIMGDILFLLAFTTVMMTVAIITFKRTL